MPEMMENVSTFKFFILSGLQDSVVYKPLYFLLVFVLYILIIIVNLTLIFIVTVDKSLHEPMYIFICNLCANGLWDGSVNLPISVRNILATQFLILPPLLNPIIYGLQLPQIRKIHKH
ncbi:olfactory receptor 6E1-like [Alosa pseudoharengus]|uniref:olfactory receptor 6E1-like n=1 Tax=Alosa pseudoharengus TaxID=34774 RepID=UPI003F8BA61D